MEIREAAAFFEDDANISKILGVLDKCGLGYIKLSQSVSSLSSGELLRLHFGRSFAAATEKSKERSVFIFDEPSRGLHFADVEKLLAVFKTLNNAGHTVVLAEHRSQIIASADYVIDLGPGRGEEGGNVVFQGKVKDILNCVGSVTGKMLRKLI